jgi:hypothetical protein
MSETLHLLHYERDEDGHIVEVYKDQYGNIRRITVFPTVDFIRHQTQVLEANEHLYRQRARTEMAQAELQDVRDLINARRREFQQQLAPPTAPRSLPPPRKNGG